MEKSYKVGEVFEDKIEEYLTSPEGGWQKATDEGYCNHNYRGMALDIVTLTDFVKASQPMAWKRFERMCSTDPVRQFYKGFDDAVNQVGLIEVLRHGFKHRSVQFSVCYFAPESKQNKLAVGNYQKNTCQCIRQWHYSETNTNTVDMMLALNGIPIVAIELKNQLTGQSIDDSKRQWMYNRDPKEPVFGQNRRILAYFAVDLYNAAMTTVIDRYKTQFLPFNQGSNGVGRDGDAGNPQAEDGGYATSYVWKEVWQKDKLLDILQKFIHVQKEEKITKNKDGSKRIETKMKVIFPRYHQLDVVRKLVDHVRDGGAGHNYLIQHSAGSGKSNSIVWTAYRMASLHNADNEAIFNSVIIVSDRQALNQQLQAAVSSLAPILGDIVTINNKKSPRDLKNAISNGKRIIVITPQKLPVVYDQVKDTAEKHFAVIMDETHSGQSAQRVKKMKMPLPDVEDALKEYAELESKAEEKMDDRDIFVLDMLSQGRHKNLSFFAFTATPKRKTLEIFGETYPDGSFHPFHIYSIKQTIELENKEDLTNPEKARFKKEKMSPLEEIIQHIHEEFIGEFTEADKVIVESLYNRLKLDENVQKAVKIYDRLVYDRSVFPDIFDETAIAAYTENEEIYRQLFLDVKKYHAVQIALADKLYRELHS